MERQELGRLQTRLAEYYGPVLLRLHRRNKREIVAVRARTALSRLSVLGALSLLSGAVSGRLPDHGGRLHLRAASLRGWRPPAVVTPATLLADLEPRARSSTGHTGLN